VRELIDENEKKHLNIVTKITPLA